MQDQGKQVGRNPMFHFALALFWFGLLIFVWQDLTIWLVAILLLQSDLPYPVFCFFETRPQGPSLISNSRQSSCLTLWVLEIPVGATLPGSWRFSVEKKKKQTFTNQGVTSFGAPLVQCYYLNVLTSYFKERISFILDVFSAPNSSWCRVVKGILHSCQLPLHSCRLQGLWACLLSVQPLLWGSSSSLWASHGLIIQVLELKLKE